MDRRLHARETTCRPCAVSTANETQRGTVLNMSDNGLMLLTVLDIQENDPIQITLNDRVGEPLVVSGRVARMVEPGEEPQEGQHAAALGIRLDYAPDEYLLLLSSIIFSRVQHCQRPKPRNAWSYERSSERRLHIAHCSLESIHGVADGTLRDLSETGLFVQTKHPAQLGEKMVISIYDQDGRTYMLHSTVVRSEYRPHGVEMIPDEGLGLAIDFATNGYYELCDSLCV
jgi:hypothetical protein